MEKHTGLNCEISAKEKKKEKRNEKLKKKEKKMLPH